MRSQQPRSADQAPDGERGWGRPAVASDYAYDAPHQLGTMRTGPDLLNVGARQPSKDWHLGHLYQPRAYVPGSIMPAYPYLFAVKDAAEEGDEVAADYASEVIYVPQTTTLLAPLLTTVPLQIFACAVAEARGLNVDQPRNLAKSVTVE